MTSQEIDGIKQEDHPDNHAVLGRALTQNIDSLVRYAAIPIAILKRHQTSFKNAHEYYRYLADIHLAQLVFLPGDLVSDMDDFKSRYVALCLFRKLAWEGRLATFGFAQDDWSVQSKNLTDNERRSMLPAPSSFLDFRLYAECLEPGNMLTDSQGNITAIIDWGFAYVAPTQFSLNPPWWLLIAKPDQWSGGIVDWAKEYAEKLDAWLWAMEEEEMRLKRYEKAKRLEDYEQEQNDKKTTLSGFLPAPISTYMRQSWQAGRFWLDYAARDSSSFDLIYWKFLDERFFGKRSPCAKESDLWKSRLDLMEEEDVEHMNEFAQKKMQETGDRKTPAADDDDVVIHLQMSQAMRWGW